MLTYVVILVISIILIALAIIGVNRLLKRQEKKAQNDPNRALIYIRAGDNILSPVPGKRVYSAGEGQIYIYTIDKKEHAVTVPAKYGYHFISGRRVIGVDDGLVFAAPIMGDSPVDAEESSEDIAQLVKGKIFNGLVYSLKGPATNVIIAIVIIAIVGIAGIYMFTHHSQDKTPVVSPTPTIPVPLGVPTSYSLEARGE